MELTQAGDLAVMERTQIIEQNPVNVKTEVTDRALGNHRDDGATRLPGIIAAILSMAF